MSLRYEKPFPPLQKTPAGADPFPAGADPGRPQAGAGAPADGGGSAEKGDKKGREFRPEGRAGSGSVEPSAGSKPHRGARGSHATPASGTAGGSCNLPPGG